MQSALIGRWSFIIGVVLAVLAGLTTVPASGAILFVLGLIVGFLNIGDKESQQFLVGVIALLVIGVAGLQLGAITMVVSDVLQQFVSFVAAAGLVVALKEVLEAARKT